MTADHGKAGQVTKMYDLVGNAPKRFSTRTISWSAGGTRMVFSMPTDGRSPGTKVATLLIGAATGPIRPDRSGGSFLSPAGEFPMHFAGSDGHPMTTTTSSWSPHGTAIREDRSTHRLDPMEASGNL